MLMDPSSSLMALMAFAGLTLLHVSIELIHRNIQIGSGKAKPTSFGKMRNADETTFVGRVSNSHANCLENLPLFAVVILVNHLVDGAPDISDKAWYYVMARTIQALAHWTGVGETPITIRFLGFVCSKGLLLTMAYNTIMG